MILNEDIRERHLYSRLRIIRSLVNPLNSHNQLGQTQTFPVDSMFINSHTGIIPENILDISAESKLSVDSEARQENRDNVPFVPIAKCILQECCELLF